MKLNGHSAVEPVRYTVLIYYRNGSMDGMFKRTYQEARDYCRDGISYSGGRVTRVEVLCPDKSKIAIWDITWDAVSQHAGLHR